MSPNEVRIACTLLVIGYSLPRSGDYRMRLGKLWVTMGIWWVVEGIMRLR